MDYYLNELSLTKVSEVESARQMMQQFILTCRALKAFGFGSLRIADSRLLLTYELCGGYSVLDWRNDRNVNRDYKTRFLSLATQSPLVSEENEKLIHRQALSEFRVVNEEERVLCKGLGLAYLDDTISISFNSNDAWNNYLIDINYLLLNDDETFSEQAISVRHASDVLHLDKCTDWINLVREKGVIENWYPPDNYFPRIEISNQLVHDGDWTAFYLEMQQLPERLRIGRFIEIAEKIATRNGYVRDGKISRINNRIVFAAGYSQGRIYLALDTMHGSFEVCNYKGSSVGEYGFHGNRIDEGHSIQI